MVRYFAKVGGRDRELTVSPSGDALEVSLEGRTYRVDLSTIHAGEKYSVLVDQRSYSVSVDGDGRDLALIVSGRSFSVSVEDERERAMAGITAVGAAAGGVVDAVMPGIVRKVEVKAGDAVVAGDRLLILEAMKMENEIRAELDGVVGEVHVKDEQAVEAGQPLVTIRPSEAS